jgi:signal transduction histidine kinase
MLTTAQVCGDLLTNLISNVLDRAKTEIGDLEILPTKCKIHELITKFWNISQQMISGKSLKGFLSVDKHLP